MSNKLTYRLFYDSAPLDNLTRNERKRFAEQCAERVGTALNDWFNGHADEFERMVKND